MFNTKPLSRFYGWRCSRTVSAAVIGLAVALAGCTTGAAPVAHRMSTDYLAVAAAASEAIRDHHYDPSALDDPAYRATEASVVALAAQALSREEFISGFNSIWREGPFSHVRLTEARASAADTAVQLDQLRAGEGARLTWEGDVAVLTVTTLIGVDTIEQIDAAYDEITSRGASGLIIDMRNNEGGAFAVRPLIGHLIDTPFDAGAFVSRHWTQTDRTRGPTRAEIEALSPWEGWSLMSFWRDVSEAPVTRLQFTPMAPRYGGPVFVLIGARSFSAAELAADALATSGRATLIGETTAGRMLSQQPFDLPNGFQLFLPTADYYGFRTGRIEGVGVAPDVAVAVDDAMAEALSRLGR